jgi:D-alanyl-D-alanine carboxypeptidase
MMFDVDALENLITRKVYADEFSGVVLITHHDTIIFEQVHGLANRRYAVPNQLDTRFNLASMNKMFTGVAVTQLAQAGKLEFNDLVGCYLPDYPNRDVRENVTIHHLLTHTSGLGTYWEDENFHQMAKTNFRKIWDYLDLVCEASLHFRPGTAWKYSDTGFLLLGAIIEIVTEESYYGYVRENIYSPAGMGSTDSYAIDEPIPNLAIGYTKFNGKGQPPLTDWRSNNYIHPMKGVPDGGGYSNVRDLLRFAQALKDETLLDETHRKIIMTPKVQVEGEYHYGYGFRHDVRSLGQSFGHTGGFPGAANICMMYPDLNYTTIVLSNCDAAYSWQVMEKIQNLIVECR